MTPYHTDDAMTLYCGDALETLRALPDGLAQCCVTSPPYWGLRDYGVEGQQGLEPTPEAYVAGMVAVFREVRRVLREDGTCWVNVGDSYVGPNNTANGGNENFSSQPGRVGVGTLPKAAWNQLPAKNLVGIPWRLAFALQADGWYLRSDCIWSKPNPMPESVTDRPTKAHEYVFLLSKAARYYYDAEAVKETAVYADGCHGASFCDDRDTAKHPNVSRKQRKPAGWDTAAGSHGAFHREGRAQTVEYTETAAATRNLRTVWTIPTEPVSLAHFACMPSALAARCILAGSRMGDVVLDPYNGAGTTGLVCQRTGRRFVGIELKREYCDMALARWRKPPAGEPDYSDLPLLAAMGGSTAKIALAQVVLG